MGTGRIGRTATFAGAARCYWLEVFRATHRELREWQWRAEAISDPVLRHQALLAQQTKNGNAEGLAAFAVLAPRNQRRRVVRALIAYQTALDYLDTITDPPRDSDELKLLHALEVAVDDERSLTSFRVEIAGRGDGDYLMGLVAACRESLAALPSYAAALAPLRRRARLGAESQDMNHSLLMGRQETELAEWAREVGRKQVPDTGLVWWETFAAGASTPAFGALVSLAAQPGAGNAELAAVERAYFPWVNALNTLLDNLVDLDEDPPQLRHINRYGSAEEAADRLAEITVCARASVSELARSHRHDLIVAAMGAYYLAQPAAWRGDRCVIAAAVLEQLGPFAGPALAVHRLRRGRSVVGARSRARGEVAHAPAVAPARAGGPEDRVSAQRTWQERSTVAVSAAPPAKK